MSVGFDVPVIPSGGILAFTDGVATWGDEDSPEQVVAKGDWIMECVKRHVQGDWGDVPPEDATANDWALIEGGRLLSAYLIPEGIGGAVAPDPKLWIQTTMLESGSSVLVTTVMWPSEY